MLAAGNVTCEECGFDGRRWDDAAAVKTLGSIGLLWRGFLAGVGEETANTRPDEGTWSIVEYADHMRGVAWNMRFVIELGVEAPGTVLDPPADDPVDDGPGRVAVDDVLDALDRESAELFRSVEALDATGWDTTVVLRGEPIGAWTAVRNALHECSHHLRDVGRIRAALGDGVRHQVGTVASIQLGSGGVPKQTVGSARVEVDGLAGDVQHDRLNHGRPFQAVCLWGTDVIDGLVAEGHPIFAGAAGENLTLDGIAWADLRAGAFLHVGDELVLELSSPAVPCSKNAPWFVDGRFDRILHTKHPGWSRLYASVVVPGDVRAGDAVEVEPR